MADLEGAGAERADRPAGPAPAAAAPPDATVVIGHAILDDFGSAGSGLTQDAIEAIEALPPASALLVVQRGPNAGARFLLDAAVTTAGRSTKSDIFLDDVTVSRHHADFLGEAGHFRVRDAGSLNGTYVGGERIDEIELKGGDEVWIGKYRLTFHPSPRRHELLAKPNGPAGDTGGAA
jgi:pSer/pThr/pTyr-binding forkhead associated (FHA) protein